ncbi:hypothetical protein SAMN04515656_10325 [Eubacterium aggregans]|uniref:Uncharacterized protein n=1 Tax=Eubacterium aggregans TaxID=81409 RepID=A0A1H3Y1F1_9FIRM|nr:hypothetical protein [Eubacterium aggregans]SEA05489.1 hypothetical protein SAMN04515656_10325 [Eubacterium aggregans]
MIVHLEYCNPFKSRGSITIDLKSLCLNEKTKVEYEDNDKRHIKKKYRDCDIKNIFKIFKKLLTGTEIEDVQKFLNDNSEHYGEMFKKTVACNNDVCRNIERVKINE